MIFVPNPTFTTMKLRAMRNSEFGVRSLLRTRGSHASRITHHASLFALFVLAVTVLASAAYAGTPSISGSAARVINDKQTTLPFSDLDINGASDVTVTIGFTDSHGSLSPTNDYFTHSANLYTLALTNTADAEIGRAHV